MLQLLLTLRHTILRIIHLEYEALVPGLAAEIVPSKSRSVHQITCLAHVSLLDVVGGQ
jgi:hypothetical protein